MKHIIALLIAGCVIGDTRCYADDRLMLDAYTKHSSDCQYAYAKTCQRWDQPRRLSWQHDFTDSLSSDVGFGTNSYGAGSANIGAAWQPLHAGPVKVGAFVSYVTGYTCAQLKTCNVFGGAIATVQIKRAVVELMYVPAIGSGTISVAQVRAGVSF
jgi:hypothetical protein